MNADQPPVMKRRVIKLGGSLLEGSEVVNRLRYFIANLPPMANFLVVGGGQAANLIREWDSDWQLGESRSHRLAIFAMTWNAKRQFEHASGFRFIRHPKSLGNPTDTRVILTEPFLQGVSELGRHKNLPESWDITSDSIAAFVADVLNADQLLMLKSVDCVDSTLQGHHSALPENRFADVFSCTALQYLADKHFVDREFPKYASKIPEISWCNFRTWGQ